MYIYILMYMPPMRMPSVGLESPPRGAGVLSRSAWLSNSARAKLHMLRMEPSWRLFCVAHA